MNVSRYSPIPYQLLLSRPDVQRFLDKMLPDVKVPDLRDLFDVAGRLGALVSITGVEPKPYIRVGATFLFLDPDETLEHRLLRGLVSLYGVAVDRMADIYS